MGAMQRLGWVVGVAVVLVLLAGCGGGNGVIRRGQNPTPGGTLEGQVDLAGEDPTDYEVMVDGRVVQTTITANGGFTVNGVPAGEHTVDVVRKDGMASGRVVVDVDPDDPTIIPEPIKLEGAGQIVGFVVKVVGGVEQPAAGVEVVARSDLAWIMTDEGLTVAPADADEPGALIYPPPEGAQYSAFTEEDGSYQMKGVAPGGYFVAAAVPGFTPGEAYVWVEANRTAAADLVLYEAVEAGVGTVKGTVLGETATGSTEPLLGAEVVITTGDVWYAEPLPEPVRLSGPLPAGVKGMATEDDSFVSPSISWGEFRTLTDRAGTYTLNVPSGYASMSVWLENYEGDYRDIQVQPDQVQVQDFLLRLLKGAIYPPEDGASSAGR
ncbi:MAG: carboxypeptidase-like regulatory domain-containing protein [Armatimonadota bacterium]